jgi:hypothetical protein
MRHFLPFVSASAVAVNAVDFGTTFFETNTIKYQLTLDEHHFSQNTLLSMIFTQTIYPVNLSSFISSNSTDFPIG